MSEELLVQITWRIRRAFVLPGGSSCLTTKKLLNTIANN